MLVLNGSVSFLLLPCAKLIYSDMATPVKISGSATLAVLKSLDQELDNLISEFEQVFYEVILMLRWLEMIQGATNYLLDEFDPNEDLPEDIIDQVHNLIDSVKRVPGEAGQLARMFQELQYYSEKLYDPVDEWEELEEGGREAS